MLLAFRVSNYRSIKDPQTLTMAGTSLSGPHRAFDIEYPGSDCGVLPCAVIYGANASGKSNLISALSKMRHIVLTSQADALIGRSLKSTPFLLDKEWAERPTTFEASFLIEGTRFDYGFDYDSRRVVAEWLFSYPEGRKRKLFERDGVDIDFGSSLKGLKRVFETLIKENALFVSLAMQDEASELKKVGDFFQSIFFVNDISVPSPQVNAMFGEKELDRRTISFLDSLGTGVCDYRFEAVDAEEDQVDFINTVMRAFASYKKIELSSEDFESMKKQNEVLLGHRTKADDMVYFQTDMESAGTRRLLVLLNGLFDALDNGNLIVVDEIDASLHTGAVESLIRLFLNDELNSRGAQLIATTHDTNMLNSEILRRDEIWFSSKSIDGSSRYYSLAEIQVRKDEAFEKSYLTGRYGAVPPKPFLSSLSRKEDEVEQ